MAWASSCHNAHQDQVCRSFFHEYSFCGTTYPNDPRLFFPPSMAMTMIVIVIVIVIVMMVMVMVMIGMGMVNMTTTRNLF